MSLSFILEKNKKNVDNKVKILILWYGMYRLAQEW